MSQNASVWVVLLVALAAANLPFLNERLFGLVPLPGGVKLLAVRVGELVVLYFVSGGIGLLFESRAGQIAPQGWEFYAVTAALFVVLAFPGFTWRYLLKHRSHAAHG
ncbi:DUF2818 family protein [Variovorax sp. PBL-E5]|uniref:DUF2818 family protein n=1 Tax=Variovorax sp. PBL-E5 TaxID=434014 RepID=UPI001317934F|nr:DUF2818 family protein [Variovorax sp. PBL-E5]VTU31555.1 hypothetical protein E5CHR_03239 [Variovorax sp. PBL-E5]